MPPAHHVLRALAAVAIAITTIAGPALTGGSGAAAAPVPALTRDVDALIVAPTGPGTASTAGALVARQQLLESQATLIRAQDKARKAAAAAARAALGTRLGFLPGTTEPREIARQMMAANYGWGAAQFRCYDTIIMAESGWKATADNPTSSAYGIPQALPGKRMAEEGPDWRTNPVTQIRWGLRYVDERFGSPCEALQFRKGHGWY